VEWLNYHHLLYFWTVARTGSIARASDELRLSQPTISNQIKTLETTLGVKLFERQGRRLALTDVGQTAMRYADEIFRTGRELQLALKGAPTGERIRLVAGVTDVIPKAVAERLLAPALKVERISVVCREGPAPRLLAALALHEIDVVLSDAPAAENVKVRAYSHRLGDCGVSFLAAAPLATLRRKFPASLDQAPFLLPADGTAMRRSLESWFEQRGLRPVITGEFDDSALMKAFGSRGLGVFAVPSVIEAEVCRQFDVQPLGRIEELRESYYAITVERRLRHPAVVAIAEAARDETFRSAR
jgi:LysR family transcriptional regulator, transcriptional activator of nhaA